MDHDWENVWTCGFRFELILVTHLEFHHLEFTWKAPTHRGIWGVSSSLGTSITPLVSDHPFGQDRQDGFCGGGWAGRSGHRLRCYWYSVKQWHDIMYIIYIYIHRICNGLSLDLKSLELQMRWFSTRGNRVTTNLHQCCTLFKLDVSRHVADTWVLCTWLWSLWSWKLMDTSDQL